MYASVTLFMVLLSASACTGPAVFVKSDAAPGGNGANWDSALISIQDGIDAVAAIGGGEVWIAGGVYSNEADPTTKAMLVMRDGVSLYGGFSGGENNRDRANPAVNQTILDASSALNGGPALHVLRGASGVTLDGLTIRDYVALEGGAAMFFYRNLDVRITRCLLENLRAVAMNLAVCENILLEYVIFREIVVQFESIVDLSGVSGTIIVEHCSFLDNSSAKTIVWGEEGDDLLFSECLFLRNKTTWGGMITWFHYSRYVCSSIFSKCWFEENDVAAIIHFDGSNFATINNCVFTNNIAGCILCFSGDIYEKLLRSEEGEGEPITDLCSLRQVCSNEIINCTFVDNQASSIVSNEQQTLPIINSIFSGNNASEAENYCGLPVISNSILQRQFLHTGGGNFVGNPVFIVPGSLRLGANSPGIGTGLDVSGPEHGYVTTDITGRPRGVYGAGYDMGAYQSGHAADLNADNRFSISELLRVIQFYNIGAYHCGLSSEDGYAPRVGLQYCAPHSSDYEPQDWIIGLNELLRLIQFWNSGGYHLCAGSEDGFCPGLE